LYNEKTYIPKSVQLDHSWGPWFVESKDLPFNVFHELEASKVKNQFCEYVNQMEAMYKKWEKQWYRQRHAYYGRRRSIDCSPISRPTGTVHPWWGQDQFSKKLPSVLFVLMELPQNV
jgi:hypothetical protein